MPPSTVMAICTVVAALNAPQENPLRAMRASLPRVVGEVRMTGLEDRVVIQRDRLGVPRVTGTSYDDVIRAQGYLHGQDRFFQMDLSRRYAAGRMAEVAGPMVEGTDRSIRRYRFEAVATALLERLDPRHRHQLEVYAAGVNAGLEDLGAPPPEYSFVPGVTPEPWHPRDSVLVMLSLFETLNFNKQFERAFGTGVEVLAPEVFAFLTPTSSRFDAPMLQRDDAAYAPMAIPGPEVIDLRRRESRREVRDLVEAAPIALGSNNWAVAGVRSVHGGAMIANDPHLPLTAPGIWYRTELAWDGGWVGGVSLPGNPGIVIGSNGHIAWGFTNTMADFQDLIVIEVDPADADRYLTPDGPEAFGEVVERIGVHQGFGEIEYRELRLRSTRWGLVHDSDRSGRPLVLKWTALEPDFVNLDVLDLVTARSLEEGVEIAREWGGPSQNAVIADADGRIAWVVTGKFPNRVGFNGRIPRSWADGRIRWDGFMDERFRPMIIDPEDGVLFTANNRTVGTAWADRLGNTWDLGARASRIRELLGAQRKFTEEDMLAIQLDTRVKVFDLYADMLLAIASETPDDPIRAEAERLVAAWDGTADRTQPAMRILDAYREELHEALINPMVAPCADVDPRFRYYWAQSEETVRRLLEERPAHLCPPGYADWEEVISSALDRALDALMDGATIDALSMSWGEGNLARVQHPLADAAPEFRELLSMPRQPLSGHAFAVRVSWQSYGASTRVVVSPGKEQDGIIQIPAGQSGHPMSPHFRDSHSSWVEGHAVPFRTGRSQAKITLVPAE